VRRKDDTVDVVRERLRIYERDTQPLLEYYHGRAGFRAVDGDQTPDAVAADLAAAVASVAGALP
jgi:adenylate kinase